jgi:hypothetical protein
MRTISHDVEDVEDGRDKYASNSSLDVVSSSSWRNELKVSLVINFLCDKKKGFKRFKQN